MSATVRPIHLPGTSALGSLRERALPALDAWARDWVMGWRDAGARSVPLIVSSAEPDVVADAAKYQILSGDTGKLWIRSTEVDRLRFGRAIVGGELMARSLAIDDWIAGVVEHAWRSRNETLFAGLFGSQVLQVAAERFDVPDVAVFGSGAVMLSCEVIGLLVVADSGVWRKSAPTARRGPLPQLTTLDQAVRTSVLRLEVTLGSVLLELPRLLDLRVGDVLRLPRRLDHPVEVTCDRRPLALASLGEYAGRRGVQLVAHSRTMNSTEQSHDPDRK